MKEAHGTDKTTLPPPKLHWGRRCINQCQADSDDDCIWDGCPQIRDNEPHTTGRHCPLDIRNDDEF